MRIAFYLRRSTSPHENACMLFFAVAERTALAGKLTDFAQHLLFTSVFTPVYSVCRIIP